MSGCEVLGGGAINPHAGERPEERVKRIHDRLKVLTYKARCGPSTAMFVNACFSRNGTELIHFNAMDSNTMPKGNRGGPVLDYLMARWLLLKRERSSTVYRTREADRQQADHWKLQ